MKIKIEDIRRGETRVIEYPLTLLQFVKIHWGVWPVYRVEKTGTNKYDVFSKLDGEHAYTASKAGKRDAVTE